MKSIAISGSKRQSTGKVDNKAIRKANKVPCVLYGGEQPIHFSTEELSFKALVYTPNTYTVDLSIEGQNYPTILQDIQFHPVTDKIIHADFYLLKEDKEVVLDIPVNLVGTSPGVLAGGRLVKNYRKLKVKALPKDQPDTVEVDISGMEIGDKKYITALSGDQYNFLHAENTIVCQVRASRKSLKEAATTEQS